MHLTPSKSLSWLVLALLPIVAYSASVSQEEFESVLRSKPDTVHGEALFAVCAACHGTDGAGASDGSVPAIAGQHFRVIVRELVDYRHDRRWDIHMEHFSDEHNLGDTQNLADVASYISSEKPAATAPVGDVEFLEHGGEVYARSCASCHGALGEGDNRLGYPRLAGQHYEYLLRQFHDAVEGRRPNFSREHIHLLAHFDRTDFVGIARYLSRLQPQAP